MSARADHNVGSCMFLAKRTSFALGFHNEVVHGRFFRFLSHSQ
ncbi:hypothetical protein GBL_1011 [Geobacillus kaustophilus GBlys]|uniref:Uncharacterized protein n=1 Tax=Geobacillus kaustophilus GBlys TaxID=1337888 RepID=U2Y1A1_GEOKU|nr:hypothetical protein GBL_1011 [Geobacillus kaustophilus GBlys]